jgi:hypothetical protein
MYINIILIHFLYYLTLLPSSIILRLGGDQNYLMSELTLEPDSTGGENHKK